MTTERISYEPKSMDIFGKTVDISTLNQKANSNTNITGVQFLRFGFLILSQVNKNDPSFWNSGIRASSDDTEDLELMKNSIRRGWDINEMLPSVTEEGTLIDGRTRVRASIALGLEKIPVAVYEQIDESKTCFITNGLKSNSVHKPSRHTKIHDYVTGAVKLHQAGELDGSEQSIMNFLRLSGIEEQWPTNTQAGATLNTTVKNKIIKELGRISRKKDKNYESVITKGNKKEYEDMVDSIIPSEIRDNHITVQFDYIGDAPRVFVNHIMSHVRNRTTENSILNIILYCKQDCTPSEYDKNLRMYMKKINEIYDDCFMIAGSDGNYKRMMKSIPPYRFYGVVPQVENRSSHMNLDGKNLKSDGVVPLQFAFSEENRQLDMLFEV